MMHFIRFVFARLRKAEIGQTLHDIANTRAQELHPAYEQFSDRAREYFDDTVERSIHEVRQNLL